MNTTTAPVRAWTTPLAVGAGLVALAARTPSAQAVFVTTTVGLLGLLAPVATAAGPPSRRSSSRFAAVVAMGAAPFFLASYRMRPSFVHAGLLAIVASLAAAVAEEIFFRRLVFGWLFTWGPAAAIGGSAALFALVHAPAYGPAVLPIDFAAGLIFGWQRWATGGWAAPALTHSIANVLAAW